MTKCCYRIGFSNHIEYAANQAGIPGPNIGKGVGMAIGLFLLKILSSVTQHQVSYGPRRCLKENAGSIAHVQL